MRLPLRIGPVLLISFLMPGTSRAGLFWKVAAEAPRAPLVTAILGDDRRTIAFTPGATWELDGTRWTRVRLTFEGSEIVPGTPFFAGGRFFAVSGGYPAILLRVRVLDGTIWRSFAEVASPGASWAFGPDRLYVTTAPYGACRNGGCNTDATKWGAVVSISLADGSTRAEPAPPSCSGDVFVVKGKLFMIVTSPGICGGGAFVRAGAGMSADGTTPFFRLDASGWTAQPPVPVSPETLWANAPLQSTPSTIWASWWNPERDVWETRVFDGDRWSEKLTLPKGRGYPVEWGRQILHVALRSRDPLYRLADGALVPFVPGSPFRRPLLLAGAGSRLLAWSAGNPLDVLSNGAWLETSGIDGVPSRSIFASDGQALFALSGGNVFRKDVGWTKLPPPQDSEATQAFVYRGRIGVTDGSSFPRRLLLYSDETGRWEDLGFPSSATLHRAEPVIRQAGEDLYAVGRLDETYRMRAGTWSRLRAPFEPDPQGVLRVRVALGQVYVIGDSRAYRVEGEDLLPAFADLPADWRARDVAEADGRVLLVVTVAGNPAWHDRPLVVEYAEGSWRTVVRGIDLGISATPSLDTLRLEPVAGHLFLGGNGWRWMEVSGGRLKALRGEAWVRTLSSEGGFGTSHDNTETYSAGDVLTPVVRVRKTVPAIVDAEGFGGRYRSTVFLGNFSPDRGATARLYAGASESPCFEIDLPPGTQERLEDPLAGFVGPLTIDFDGLLDDDDGWAAVRVWNEAGGGTAGVALEARDAGTFVSEGASLLLPNPRAGSRTHLAAAAGTDGVRGTIFTTGHLSRWYDPEPISLRLESGGFAQVDPDGRFAEGPITFSASGAWDDLLPYSVRNDDGTQDGIVVQAPPRWLKPGRGTLFLPAMVAVPTDAATYRSEFALGSPDLFVSTPLVFRFRGTSDGKAVDGTAHVAIPEAGVLRVEDVGTWLTSNGIPVQADRLDGTLSIDPEDGARVPNLVGYAAVLGRSPSAGGDYSTSVPLLHESEWASEGAVVPGLVENAAFRSNLAVANPEPPGGPQVTLSLTVRDDGGRVAGRLPSVTLAPGERRQVNRVLQAAGGPESGWVEIRRASGAGHFVAYGVVNDNATSDGTVFRMVRVR